MKKCLSLLLTILLFFTLSPHAFARERGDLDLSQLIEDDDSRRYVQAMLNYHLQYNVPVVENLEAGYSALFFFEGCSNNMQDRALSDIRFYRVSAVCLVVRLDKKGEPYICYFNDQCSTLPDRPLEYANRKPALGQPVGPATICDGTYELDSVRHGGVYEALHLRTSAEDTTIPAVYLSEDGYIPARADMINIHTRSGNHTIEGAMWSAGCILVGDGNFGSYTDLMESTYYAVYDYFKLGNRVGTVTIDRQRLKDKMYDLYENQDAVDYLLAESRKLLPERYLLECGKESPLETELLTDKETLLMSLPCGTETDPRSVVLSEIRKGEHLTICASIENDQGELWLRTEQAGQQGYVYSGDTKEPGGFLQWLWGIFGKDR